MSSINKFDVFGDRICVKKIIMQHKKEGILMPAASGQEEPCHGTVVSIGSGIEEKFAKALHALKKDDVVLFQVFHAVPWKVDGEMYYILAVKDVLGKIE